MLGGCKTCWGGARMKLGGCAPPRTPPENPPVQDISKKKKGSNQKQSKTDLNEGADCYFWGFMPYGLLFLSCYFLWFILLGILGKIAEPKIPNKKTKTYPKQIKYK